ncbi:hypothetical protein Tfu_1696 [Thermobifida fusca YX]|uniref:Uncharacterized protein n=1 Tax=Thermobifida fusca (strain YX) TaxID=269800 RepID=Q47P88_THEFY|nr:hypothetical protein Tfu_1696 [Thermobifida fusca YX]
MLRRRPQLRPPRPGLQRMQARARTGRHGQAAHPGLQQGTPASPGQPARLAQPCSVRFPADSAAFRRAWAVSSDSAPATQSTKQPGAAHPISDRNGPAPGDAPASHNAAHQPAVESAGCSFKASPHGRMRRNPCSGTAMMQRKGE